MQHTIRIYLAVLAMSFVYSGVSQACENRTAGNIVGALIGGILGNQVGGGSGRDVATVIGAIGGAYLGGEIACSMDDRAQQEYGNARVRYFDGAYNQPYRWQNGQYGGDLVYTRGGYYNYNNRPLQCRDYQSVFYSRGQQERVSGTVCRFPDGSVRDVSSREVYYDNYYSNPRYRNPRHR